MGMAIDFMADPRTAKTSASASLNASLALLPPAPKRSAILRFADFFIDGCDVRLFRDGNSHAQATLPDGSLITLGSNFRVRDWLANFGSDHKA